MASSNITSQTAESSTTPTPLVMQLIVEPSLIADPHWSLGPMMVQAAHATSAVLAQTASHSNTREYLSDGNLPNMRKVVLKAPTSKAGSDGSSLRKLSEQLAEGMRIAKQARVDDGDERDAFPGHHLWIEQPEGVATVLAIAPNTRPSVSDPCLNLTGDEC